jgi:hypothetical protein
MSETFWRAWFYLLLFFSFSPLFFFFVAVLLEPLSRFYRILLLFTVSAT